MSRIDEIEQATRVASAAMRSLGDTIHRIFTAGRKIEYQVGMSELDSAWEDYEVVGPYDQLKVIIRNIRTRQDLTVDGRSYRLRLPKEHVNG